MSFRFFPALLSLLLFFPSCKQQAAEHSFYFWKNEGSYTADNTNDSLITSLGVNHFYLRYMDIGWSENLQIPLPTWGVDNYISFPAGMVRNFTPVIFISNRVFERISDNWCDDSLTLKLKKAIDQKTTAINERYVNTVFYKVRPPYSQGQTYNEDSLRNKLKNSLKIALKEIQIDCDWTAKTREKYFRFLRSFKKQYPDLMVSATIRLYPYKYPKKMGVPPVDRGMLMCYNLGGLDNTQTQNSVFDLTALKQYLDAKPYRLPLDIGLPVFGWYAWFRGNTLKGIIYPKELAENDLHDYFLQKGNSYQLKEDYTISDHYLRKGDLLREEFPQPPALEEAAHLLKEKFPDTRRITFFHWDPQLLTQYDRTIRKIYAVF